jgi:hypothetical protein
MLTPYFSHDFHARSDQRIIGLRMKHGMAGVGIFWCLVEMLHEANGYIKRSECERIAFDLRIEKNALLDIISCDLFCSNDDVFWSESVLLRIKEREQKSSKARDSAQKRWQKHAFEPQKHANALNIDTDAMQTQCDGNAIKKSKVKESKVNNKAREEFENLIEAETSDEVGHSLNSILANMRAIPAINDWKLCEEARHTTIAAYSKDPLSPSDKLWLKGWIDAFGVHVSMAGGTTKTLQEWLEYFRNWLKKQDPVNKSPNIQQPQHNHNIARNGMVY